MAAILQEPQWIAFATGIAGLLIGALISELHVALAGVRERRRALNVLLFDLLQLRFDVRTSDPRILIETLERITRKQFPSEPWTMPASVRSIVVNIQKETLGDTRRKLTERYETAIGALVPHDPLLAYQLAGRELISRLERAIGLYYEKIAQLPDVAKDPNAPQVLNVMVDETTSALIAEVLNELANDIHQVARARQWWPLRFIGSSSSVRRFLQRQDGLSLAAAERQLEVLFGRVIPRVETALQVATPRSTQQAASEG